MSYCQITDRFAEVYSNNSLVVTLEDPPVNYLIDQFTYSKTIYWDNQSLTEYYPENITYSVENIPGLPYRIRWDTSQAYVIQNPTNYSYSIVNNYNYPNTHIKVWYSMFLGRSNNWSGEINYGYRFNVVIGDIYFVGKNIYLFVNGSPVLINPTNETTIQQVRINRIEVYWVSNNAAPNAYQIKIRDGSTTTYYPIINTNSVWIENTVASKKININGTKYDLSNENSIHIDEVEKYKLIVTSQNHTIEQVYNTSPTVNIICGEDCPPDTCKIECDDHYCCYASSGQVIKIIPK